MTDRKELKDEELGRVTGGAEPTQAPKYQRKTKVRFYLDKDIDLQAIGTITSASWSDDDHQYLYWIDHDEIRYVFQKELCCKPAGSYRVKEENIMYAL